MRRRLAGAALALLVATVACAREPRGPYDGFRDLDEGEVIPYSLHVAQQRTTSGLGAEQSFPARIDLRFEEDATSEERYEIVVRRLAGAVGEEGQRVAAERLVGRRLAVDLDDGRVRASPDLFSGTDDIAAADIALLTVLFAPVIPSPRVEKGARWRTSTTRMRVPWSLRPVHFTIDNEVTAIDTFRNLDAARVRSSAIANVRFRLPIVVPREPGRPPSGSDDLIVNELFESLFADVDNPIQGLAATIAAIPLAIVAPFLALGEALGNLFGGGSDEPDEPQIPVVDLAGPLELDSRTAVWLADGRVLDSVTDGTLKLSGRMPDLPGAASELSGKTLRLDASFRITRKHLPPFPAPRDPPGRGWAPLVAIVLTALALALAVWSTVSRRRSPA